jgi:hypothetical protein
MQPSAPRPMKKKIPHFPNPLTLALTKFKAAHSDADKDHCLQNMYFQLEDIEDV